MVLVGVEPNPGEGSAAAMGREDERPAASLGDALDGFLRETGLLEVSREKLCAVIWGEVVGKWYARFTAVTRVHRGVVYVRCDSAPRANQLQLDAPKIIERLNDRLGGECVKEIRPSSAGIGSGHKLRPELPDLPAAPTEAELEAIAIAAEELERIRAKVKPLADEQIRERIEAMLVKQARVRRWQAEHGYSCCEVCGAYFMGGGRFCLACRAPVRPRVASERAEPYRRYGSDDS